MHRFRAFCRSLISFPLFVGILLGIGGTALAGQNGSAVFRDVVAGSYYDNAVGEMYASGIIKGYADGRFGPDDYVTRAQVAVMMQRLRDDVSGVTPRSSSSSSRSSSSSSSSSSSYDANNSNGVLAFSTPLAQYTEVAKNVSIAVVRSGGTKGSVNVSYSMTGGTAIPASHYTPSTGTLTFADGETTKTFAIKLVRNTAAEGTKNFFITLKNPTGGAVLGSQNKLDFHIIDADGGGDNANSSASRTSSSSSSATSVATGFSFTASAFGVMENAGSVSITVQRTGSTTSAGSVNYATSAGTAQSAEFTNVSGTLNFSAGETTKSFTVAVQDDSVIDGNKSVNLTLTTPVSSALMTPSAATLSIVDDDVGATGTGTVQFTSSTYRISESQGYAVISVVRGGDPTKTASVAYATNGGTAITNADYTAVSGTLNFAIGEMTKVFLVPVVKDDLSEDEEAVNLQLSSPTHLTLGTTNIAVLKIQE